MLCSKRGYVGTNGGSGSRPTPEIIKTMKTLVITCLILNLMSNSQGENLELSDSASVIDDKSSHYRLALAQVIKSQSADILASDLQERLLGELERPFAFNGNTAHYPFTNYDLETGWAIDENEKIVYADLELTFGEIDSGRARQIYVRVTLYRNENVKPLLTITICPVGRPATKQELEDILISDEDWEKLRMGIHPAGLQPTGKP